MLLGFHYICGYTVAAAGGKKKSNRSLTVFGLVRFIINNINNHSNKKALTFL